MALCGCVQLPANNRHSKPTILYIKTIAGHKELARKIAKLERKLGDHDEQIMVLVEAIKQLMDGSKAAAKDQANRV